MLVESLKLGKAKYKVQSVRAPDDSPVQYFINPDKSIAQIRKEILGKALFELIAKEKPDLAINYQRAAATVWCDNRPICTVKILSESEAKISWMESRRLKYGLQLENIEPAFASIAAARAASKAGCMVPSGSLHRWPFCRLHPGGRETAKEEDWGSAPLCPRSERRPAPSLSMSPGRGSAA